VNDGLPNVIIVDQAGVNVGTKALEEKEGKKGQKVRRTCKMCSRVCLQKRDYKLL